MVPKHTFQKNAEHSSPTKREGTSIKDLKKSVLGSRKNEYGVKLAQGPLEKQSS